LRKGQQTNEHVNQEKMKNRQQDVLRKHKLRQWYGMI